MNQPFTLSGETQSNNMENQCLEKTIFKCDRSFPNIQHRIKVVSKEIVVLEPVDYAINLLQSKVEALEKVLSGDHISPNTLQLMLQGAILTQVNAGPLAIAETFCTKKYSKELKTNIISLLQKLENLLYKAINLNSKYITEEQHKFQNAIIEGFKKFSAKIESLGEKYNVVNTLKVNKSYSQSNVEVEGLGIVGGFLNMQDKGNKMMEKIRKSDDTIEHKDDYNKKKKLKKFEQGKRISLNSEKITKRRLKRTLSEDDL